VERILRYLCEQETDSTEEAWTLISRITADLAFTREEVYTELMKLEDEGVIEMIKTLEPGPWGLVSVAITEQGRLCFNQSERAR
jgi:DNA-binding PadR family transcriptional regulator